MRTFDIIIIGGGAAGLAAAAELAGSGLRVCVLEKNPSPGKKLLATGNGRCNLGNNHSLAGAYLSSRSDALTACLESIQNADQGKFWARLGLPVIADDEGRLYPASRQASSVLKTLQLTVEGGGIEFLCGCRVTGLASRSSGFVVETESEKLSSRAVILACGGKAAPALGGGTDGYALAKQAGHSATPLAPGLVPVKTVNPGKTMSGVRQPCEVTLLRGEQTVFRRRGEVQFTDYGLSGIVIMQLSNLLEPGDTIALDLLPDCAPDALLAFLTAKRDGHPDRKAAYLPLGLLNEKLAEPILRSCRIDGKKRLLGSLSDAELSLLTARMKHWSVRTDGTTGFEQAQVTLGGVPLNEISPDSFESKLCPGLYLAGEILDAAGDCGGYNLMWAFGSGIAAARAAQRMMR